MDIKLHQIMWHEGLGPVQVIGKRTDGWTEVIPVDRELIRQRWPQLRLPVMRRGGVEVGDDDLLEVPVGHLTDDEAPNPVARELAQLGDSLLQLPTIVHRSELITLRLAHRLAIWRRSEAGQMAARLASHKVMEARALIWSPGPGVAPHLRLRITRTVHMLEWRPVFAGLSPQRYHKIRAIACHTFGLRDEDIPLAWHDRWGVMPPIRSAQDVKCGQWMAWNAWIREPVQDALEARPGQLLARLRVEVWYRSKGSAVLRRYWTIAEVFADARQIVRVGFAVRLRPDRPRPNPVTQRHRDERPRPIYAGWGGQMLIDPGEGLPKPSVPPRPVEEAAEARRMPVWMERMLGRDGRFRAWAIVAYLAAYVQQLGKKGDRTS